MNRERLAALKNSRPEHLTLRDWLDLFGYIEQLESEKASHVQQSSGFGCVLMKYADGQTYTGLLSQMVGWKPGDVLPDSFNLPVARSTVSFRPDTGERFPAPSHVMLREFRFIGYKSWNNQPIYEEWVP